MALPNCVVSQSCVLAGIDHKHRCSPNEPVLSVFRPSLREPDPRWLDLPRCGPQIRMIIQMIAPCAMLTSLRLSCFDPPIANYNASGDRHG